MTGKLLPFPSDQQSQSFSIVVFKPSPSQPLLQLQLQTTLGPSRQSHPGCLYRGRGHRQAEKIKIFIFVSVIIIIIFILTVSTNSLNHIIRIITEPEITEPEFLTGTDQTFPQPDTQCGDGDYLGRTLFPTPPHQIVIRSLIILLIT